MTSTNIYTNKTTISSSTFTIKYGDIFLVDFGKSEYSEQSGVRPAIILQNDIGNKYSPTTLVVPLTTKSKRNLPTHIEITPENSGLREVSTALFEQIRVIDKRRIIKKIGAIDTSLISHIKKALTIAFAM